MTAREMWLVFTKKNRPEKNEYEAWTFGEDPFETAYPMRIPRVPAISEQLRDRIRLFLNADQTWVSWNSP